MPKKLIIGISIALVVVGLAVFAVLLIRSRALSEEGPTGDGPPITAPQDDGTPSDGLGSPSSDEAPPAQVGICGDGICTAGETSCSIDCGDAEERFRGSIKAKVGPTSLTISWETATPSTGEVKYGKTDQYELGTFPSATPSTKHEVIIQGTSLGQSYFIHVGATEESGAKHEAGPLLFET